MCVCVTCVCRVCVCVCVRVLGCVVCVCVCVCVVCVCVMPLEPLLTCTYWSVSFNCGNIVHLDVRYVCHYVVIVQRPEPRGRRCTNFHGCFLTPSSNGLLASKAHSCKLNT